MADTAITVTTLTPGAATASPAGTAIVHANNHVITLPRGATPEEIVIRCVNTTASEKIVTVTAGDSPPASGGEPAAITSTLAAGNSTPTESYIRGLSSKNLQSNGTIVITVAASMTGFIAALWVKRG